MIEMSIQLNWTAEVIICFITVIVLSIVSTASLLHYRKNGYRHAYYLGLFWLFVGLWCFFCGLSFLFLSVILRKIAIITVTFVVYFGVLLSDSVSSKFVNWKKMSLFFILISLTIYGSFDPNGVKIAQYPNGDWSVLTYGFYKYLSICSPLFSVSLMSYYFAKIHIRAPKSMRLYSGLMLYGSLFSFTLVFAIAFKLTDKIPALLQIVISISSIAVIYGMLSEPRLAFILPFKVRKITVIATETGIPIYNYIWNEESKDESSDDVLFSGMIHGINLFVAESIGSGNIKEIFLDNATLMLKKSDTVPMVCVLTANKASDALRKALENFAEHFFEQYGSHISQASNRSLFSSATDLILKYFPFVPVFD